MNILKEWFMCNWDSNNILYECKLHKSGFRSLSLDNDEVYYTLHYRFEDCAPIVKFCMLLVYLLSNIFFAVLYIFKYLFFTLWISPKSNLGKQIKENKEIQIKKFFCQG